MSSLLLTVLFADEKTIGAGMKKKITDVGKAAFDKLPMPNLQPAPH